MRLFAQDIASHGLTSDDLHLLAARGLSEAGGPKPLLLRVLTDLFIMRPTHSAEDARQFAEIAHRLLPEATQAEIDHAAKALCRHAAAPPDLLDRLATRGGEGSRKLLAECRALSTQVLADAAKQGEPEEAIAVARRADLDAAIIRALAGREEIEVLRTLAANEAAPLPPAVLSGLVDRGRDDEELALSLVARLPHRPEVLPLFTKANPRDRALMIARTREREGEEEPVSSALEHGPETALRRIEAIALDGAQDDLARALAEACGCDEDQARAILADASGEPLAIALRALGFKPEVATRIFLFVDPQISHSFGRVSALARLANSLSQHVARRLLDAMTGRAAIPARHTPLHDPTARMSSSRASLSQGRATRSATDLLRKLA